MNVSVENSFQMSELVPFVTFRQRSKVRYVSRRGNCHQCEFDFQASTISGENSYQRSLDMKVFILNGAR